MIVPTSLFGDCVVGMLSAGVTGRSPQFDCELKTIPLFLSTLTQHTLGRSYSVIVPTFLSGGCVVGMLPVGSLTEAHNS